MLASPKRIPPHRVSASDPTEPGGAGTPDIEVIEPPPKLYPRYKVFVHNDDVTPMALVIGVLRSFFGLGMRRSQEVTVEAHHTGVAFVIALTLEQAEFRVQQAHSLARGQGYPLTFTYEPE